MLSNGHRSTENRKLRLTYALVRTSSGNHHASHCLCMRVVSATARIAMEARASVGSRSIVQNSGGRQMPYLSRVPMACCVTGYRVKEFNRDNHDDHGNNDDIQHGGGAPSHRLLIALRNRYLCGLGVVRFHCGCDT